MSNHHDPNANSNEDEYIMEHYNDNDDASFFERNGTDAVPTAVLDEISTVTHDNTSLESSQQTMSHNICQQNLTQQGNESESGDNKNHHFRVVDDHTTTTNSSNNNVHHDIQIPNWMLSTPIVDKTVLNMTMIPSSQSRNVTPRQGNLFTTTSTSEGIYVGRKSSSPIPMVVVPPNSNSTNEGGNFLEQTTTDIPTLPNCGVSHLFQSHQQHQQQQQQEQMDFHRQIFDKTVDLSKIASKMNQTQFSKYNEKNIVNQGESFVNLNSDRSQLNVTHSGYSYPNDNNNNNKYDHHVRKLIPTIQNVQQQQPYMKHPSKCPLFCCFYAEFDIVVGPKVLYQSPENFMENDISISIHDIENQLQETFTTLQSKPETTSTSQFTTNDNDNFMMNDNNNNSHSNEDVTSKGSSATDINTSKGLFSNIDSSSQANKRDYVTDYAVQRVPSSDNIGSVTIPSHRRNPSADSNASGRRSVGYSPSVTSTPSAIVGTPPTTTFQMKMGPTVTSGLKNIHSNISTMPPSTSHGHRRTPSTDSISHGHRRTPSTDSLTGVPRAPKRVENKTNNIQSSDNTNNNSVHLSIPTDLVNENRTSTIQTTTQLNHSNTIFDSCSEYIITGEELTGNLINLSTHNIHVLTRPTSIHDTIYERNSLLFCVGFILRRSTDPRPFRTILSKVAALLHEMEMESKFITNAKKQNQQTDCQSPSSSSSIQHLLETLLLSLNSVNGECNLLLQGDGKMGTNIRCANNFLNVKLFHPPTLPPEPVKDYAVPILVRRPWQSHSTQYDWDLSINWVLMHIDGIKNAKQISQKSEVDMEMVRACLRVLKHHGVIELVDMFFYTNRYECTDKISEILTGTNNTSPSLLDEAVDFVRKGNPMSGNASVTHNPGSIGSGGGGDQTMSPMLKSCSPVMLTMNRIFGGIDTSLSYVSPSNHYNKETSMLGSGGGGGGMTSTSYQSLSSYQPFVDTIPTSDSIIEFHEIRTAVMELYLALHRGISIGDLLLRLVSAEQNRSDTNQQRQQIKSTNLMSNQNDKNIIDWRKMCRLIDHRRFVAFGIVHGLIQRVHNYPLLMDTHNGSENFTSDTIEGKKDTGVDDDFHNFSLYSSIPNNGRYHTKRQTPNVPSTVNSTTNNSTTNKGFLSYKEFVENNELKKQVSKMMNGMHCDDELVCAFKLPLQSLFDLFSLESNSNDRPAVFERKPQSILSIYST